MPTQVKMELERNTCASHEDIMLPGELQPDALWHSGHKIQVLFTVWVLGEPITSTTWRDNVNTSNSNVLSPFHVVKMVFDL